MPLFSNYAGGFVNEHGRLMTLNEGVGLSLNAHTMPDRDWVRMRQPYLDSMGRARIALTDIDFKNGHRTRGFTRNDSRGGEKKPLVRSYLVNDLRNLGYVLPPVVNATTLRKDEWIEMDRRVVKEARQKLFAAQDLEDIATYGGFNAMGKMTIEAQMMDDPGEAVVDMDARTDARNDQAQMVLMSTPLPITHSDWGYSSRELAVSRNGDTPLDRVGMEAAGRRVGEAIEDQVIGNVTGMTYGTQTAGPGTHRGTSTVYGMRTFTYRLTKSNFTSPSGGSPETTYNEVLAAIQQLITQYFSGPFTLYYSIDWFQYMNRQFSISGGNNASETLLTMLEKIPQIGKGNVKMLERMTSTFTLVLLQRSGQTAEMINGMDVTIVQWEEKGGLDLRFKAMAIKVPRFFATYAQRTGILHGTTA